MFEASLAVQLLVDADTGDIIGANQAAATFYGYSRSVLQTMSMSALNLLPPSKLRIAMGEAENGQQGFFRMQHRLASGEVKDVEVFSSPIYSAGRRLLYSIIHDVTDRLRFERELERRARYDSLTGLPNRLTLVERVRQLLTHPDEESMLLLIDLDRFAEINDSFGYKFGDELLKQASKRLLVAVPEGTVVGRVGGDKFGVVLEGTGINAAREMSRQIICSLRRPYKFEDQRLDVGATVAIAPVQCQDGSAEAVTRRAEVALRIAKERGDPLAVYQEEEDESSARRMLLIRDLHDALECGGLHVHYQPKVRVVSRRAEHVEALIRWTHPVFGPIAPDYLVSLAEHSGQINALTAWVLNAALAQCRQWLDEGIDIGVAVNLSARNLADPDLISVVESLLDRYQLSPDRLELELTESAVMADPERSMRPLQALGDMGVKLAIDDFGTGYSSLAYLHHLPAHSLKIDRSFVTDMTSRHEDARIVHAVADLAHSLHLRVVAEGVEDAQTWDLLASMGCDAVQGYYISRPLPPETCKGWLLANSRPEIKHTATG